MRRALWKMGLVMLAILWPTGILFAQNDRQSVSVGFTLLPYQSLTVSGAQNNGALSVSTVFVPQPRIADLDRGFIDQRNAVRLSVKSNIPWQVRVRTDDADMGQSFDETYTKPIADFQLRSEGGQFIRISHSDQVLAQGEFGEHSFGIDYRTRFDKATHQEGRYRISVIYTIVSR